MYRPRILVVGSMNMDLCMFDVEGMPKIGASTFCSGYAYAEGGKGSNQAFAVARLGGEATIVGRVGMHDENGGKLLASLEKTGVNTDFIVKDQDHSTGMSVMGILPDGKYYSIYAKGANDHILPQDVERALDSESFDMILMQLEMPLETVYSCYEMARDRKIPVFLDAGPAMNIPLLRLKGLFVISPNEAETEALTGISTKTVQSAMEAARRLYHEVEPQYVLLKMGGRGVLLFDGKNAEMIPAFTVEAVDTTAAGDTFSAAFVVQYCKGRSVEEAVRFAHAAAAVCVMRKGGNPSIPSEKEMEKFYEKHIAFIQE